MISFKYRQIITVIFTVNLHIIFFTTIISNHNTSLHTSQHYFNWCSYWGFSRRCSQSKLSELIVSSVFQPVSLCAHVYQAFTECKFQHVFFNLTQFRLWAHIYTIMKAFTHIEILLNLTDANKILEKKWKRERCISFKKKKKWLTLSWRRSLSYRNQSIDLLCKLVD